MVLMLIAPETEFGLTVNPCIADGGSGRVAKKCIGGAAGHCFTHADQAFARQPGTQWLPTLIVDSS